MCGIGGIVNLRGERVPDLGRRLDVINDLIRHRGPDGVGTWEHRHGHTGFAHRRLSIFDLEHGHQPMSDAAGRWITFNGEIYNHPELRGELGTAGFRTRCDTEVLLRAHEEWGRAALDRLRGMYAFAIWDEPEDELVIVRDRFGIKPLYYAEVDGVLYFASEAKALMPFLPAIETDPDGLHDYLAFQFCLEGKTLFKGVRELLPGHRMVVKAGTVRVERYWEVYYDLDWDHTESYFEEQVEELLHDSVRLHLRSDVPVATYLSGGLDSSFVTSLAGSYSLDTVAAFTGRFPEDARYDESQYAQILADRQAGIDLNIIDIGVEDFLTEIEKVIYHLDYPTAGPGSFPQFMVARAASQQAKVVLGGQGGDEVFGGYARYLIAYFEQCIKAAIDGTMDGGNFIVSYESIIPNLQALKGYKPLLKEFWREGLFEDLDARYFRLVHRARDLDGEVRLGALSNYSPFASFQGTFNGTNVGHESYFDKMTHFDFKTLLPALLHVEDRMSMAHGLESRVPLLDHRLVELVATIPSNIKFQNGSMKHLFKHIAGPHLPPEIPARKDKMGFPVPLDTWLKGPARDFLHDMLSSDRAGTRAEIDNTRVLERLSAEPQYGRQTWGFLGLELWQRAFHDREGDFQRLMTSERTTA